MGEMELTEGLVHDRRASVSVGRSLGGPLVGISRASLGCVDSIGVGAVRDAGWGSVIIAKEPFDP